MSRRQRVLQLTARADAELAEDLAQMPFDGASAERADRDLRAA